MTSLDCDYRSKLILSLLPLRDELEPPSPLAATLALGSGVLGEQVRLGPDCGFGGGVVAGGAGDATDRFHPRHAESKYVQSENST